MLAESGPSASNHVLLLARYRPVNPIRLCLNTAGRGNHVLLPRSGSPICLCENTADRSNHVLLLRSGAVQSTRLQPVMLADLAPSAGNHVLLLALWKLMQSYR